MREGGGKGRARREWESLRAAAVGPACLCRFACFVCLAFFVCPAFLLLPGCRQKPVLMDKSAVRTDDGDTFRYGGITIRVVGIDTPEIAHEEHGLFEDQPCGVEAAEKTREILEAANRIEYISCGDDMYGRTLAHVFVDGELLAVKLLRLGLAYETVTYYGDNGYPELAARILKAAEEGERPRFEPPYIWKRKQRKKRKKRTGRLGSRFPAAPHLFLRRLYADRGLYFTMISMGIM